MESLAPPPPKSKAPHSLIGDQHLAELLAAAASSPPGCFVEVGVYRGGSAWHLLALAERQSRQLFLYDTFTGIPWKEAIDSHGVGDFADVDEAQVRQQLAGAAIVKGIFPRSAIPMPAVSFVHLDCDQYQSVREACLHLLPLMVEGGTIWFDDSPCLEGAHRAARELFGDRLRLSSDHGKHFVVITGRN